MNQAQALASKAYKTNQISTASPKKLLIMLYDGAIKNIRLAEISLADKNLEDVNKYIKKAQDIISEFMRTLDFDAAGDMAKSLYSLYEYMYQRLVKANTTKDAEPMIEVRKYLEELKAAWAQI